MLEKVKNKQKETQKSINTQEKGITLIAIVITIIVLLILAGVSIATLTGQNGILTRANDAKEQTEIASVKEQAQLDIANWMAERLKNNEDITLDDLTIKNIIEIENASNSNKYYKELQSDKIITPNGYEILYSELYTNSNGGNSGEIETESLPSTAETAPFLPEGATPTNTDWDTGVTIKDSNNNEWVWVVVPKSVTASATDDNQIMEALIDYARDYRDSFSDTWYSGCGLEEDEYGEKYSTMLQSIKTYGGFYIGKYEVGSFDNPVTSENITRETVIQKGAYPYNWVTCSQAEDLAEELATGGKTSTLMFGIQWDLVLTYLETSGGLTYNELAEDSTSRGNYRNSSFPVAEGNKYAIYSNYSLGEWADVPVNYDKPSFTANGNGVLLSTGATEDNNIMNIYDLAGNVAEWTLEKSTETDNPCVCRGGGYDDIGSAAPVSGRGSISISNSRIDVSFRPVLY